jgi:hypothetical protein
LVPVVVVPRTRHSVMAVEVAMQPARTQLQPVKYLRSLLVKQEVAIKERQELLVIVCTHR